MYQGGLNLQYLQKTMPFDVTTSSNVLMSNMHNSNKYNEFLFLEQDFLRTRLD